MKESIKIILLFLVLILALIFAPSCTKQKTIHQSEVISDLLIKRFNKIKV